MRKIAVIFLIGVIAIGILLFNRRTENTLQEGQSSLSHIASHSLPINKIPALLTKDTVPNSSLPANETPMLPIEKTAPASSKSIDILLVNASHSVPQHYEPVELINLYEQTERHFQLAQIDIELCRTVFDAMESMFSAAMKDGVDGFIIASGYRSFDQQTEIFANTTDGTAARPGTSEHETGLAFDVTAYGNENFELTPQFEWLSKHCAEYGFILRYPKGKEDITGYPYEPWHYRYVGTPYAKEIMDEGITLEEYLEQQ